MHLEHHIEADICQHLGAPPAPNTICTFANGKLRAAVLINTSSTAKAAELPLVQCEVGKAACLNAVCVERQTAPVCGPTSGVPLIAKVIGMNKPAVAPVPVTKTLAEQKSDFTAEGSPPPGKVSTAIPAGSPEPEEATPNEPAGRERITLKRIAARGNP